MSRISLKLNPTLILIALFFMLFGKLKIFAFFYLCAFLHELAHLFVCNALKEKVEKIELKSYGVCLKTGFIKNPVSSLFISVAGPVSNLIMYLCFFRVSYIFSLANLVIFFINIIPVLPLDGGVFLKSLLNYRYGYVKSYSIMIQITKIFAVLLVIFGIFLIIMTKYNISLLIIGVFLLYNIRYEKNNLISLKKKLICNEFSDNDVLKIKSLAMFCDMPIIKCIDYFSYGSIIVVTVFSKENKVLGNLTQYEITDTFFKHGVYLKLGELIKMKGI